MLEEEKQNVSLTDVYEIEILFCKVAELTLWLVPTPLSWSLWQIRKAGKIWPLAIRGLGITTNADITQRWAITDQSATQAGNHKGGNKLWFSPGERDTCDLLPTARWLGLFYVIIYYTLHTHTQTHTFPNECVLSNLPQNVSLGPMIRAWATVIPETRSLGMAALATRGVGDSSGVGEGP